LQKNPAYTKAFAESLPKAYAKSFDWAAIAEHGDVAARRKPGHVGIGSCYAPRLPGTALCVVADDRPGLLATISAAFVSERLDVIGAEAYTRKTTDGRREAVDIFWVQRLTEGDPRRPLTVDELRHLEATLDACILDNLSPKNVRLPTLPPPSRVGATETVVRFIEDREGMLGTLEVETDDRAGMLLVLSRALFDQQVQIVSSQVRTEAGRVRDRFEVTELDDQPIRPDRRLLLQVAVMSAVQAAFEH
jgi:[protein-PII] uridylyltransferase